MNPVRGGTSSIQPSKNPSFTRLKVTISKFFSLIKPKSIREEEFHNWPIWHCTELYQLPLIFSLKLMTILKSPSIKHGLSEIILKNWRVCTWLSQKSFQLWNIYPPFKIKEPSFSNNKSDLQICPEYGQCKRIQTFSGKLLFHLRNEHKGQIFK